ncbi:hypothetical protein CRUP_026302 [Coryphaenoides rupestris]|nr:hypothetical protein CRUP_026302 [Coryphaenoides rupestris]
MESETARGLRNPRHLLSGRRVYETPGLPPRGPVVAPLCLDRTAAGDPRRAATHAPGRVPGPREDRRGGAWSRGRGLCSGGSREESAIARNPLLAFRTIFKPRVAPGAEQRLEDDSIRGLYPRPQDPRPPRPGPRALSLGPRAPGAGFWRSERSQQTTTIRHGLPQDPLSHFTYSVMRVHKRALVSGGVPLINLTKLQRWVRMSQSSPAGSRGPRAEGQTQGPTPGAPPGGPVTPHLGPLGAHSYQPRGPWSFDQDPAWEFTFCRYPKCELPGGVLIKGPGASGLVAVGSQGPETSRTPPPVPGARGSGLWVRVSGAVGPGAAGTTQNAVFTDQATSTTSSTSTSSTTTTTTTTTTTSTTSTSTTTTTGSISLISQKQKYLQRRFSECYVTGDASGFEADPDANPFTRGRPTMSSGAPGPRRALLPDQSGSWGSGQSLTASRQLSHALDPIPSKRICFYKSGDPQFGGLRLVINRRTFKSFDALLDSLSTKVPLPFGLEDGKSYICSDSRKVKPINLAQARRKLPPWYNARPAGQDVQRSGKPLRPVPMVVRMPQRLTVFRNGKPAVRQTVTLQKRSRQSFEVLLESVSELLQFLCSNCTQWTGDGLPGLCLGQVDGLPALILCSGTVVAAGKEPFKPGNYDVHRAPCSRTATC